MRSNFQVADATIEKRLSDLASRAWVLSWSKRAHLSLRVIGGTLATAIAAIFAIVGVFVGTVSAVAATIERTHSSAWGIAALLSSLAVLAPFGWWMTKNVYFSVRQSAISFAHRELPGDFNAIGHKTSAAVRAFEVQQEVEDQ